MPAPGHIKPGEPGLGRRYSNVEKITGNFLL